MSEELDFSPILSRLKSTLSDLYGDEEMEAGDTEESVPTQEIDLGDGSTLTLDAQQITAMLFTPEVLAQLDQMGRDLSAAANEMAVTENAQYTYVVQANEGYKTPQLFLHPQNFQAKIDDAAHSTLLKVAASINDEVPVGVGDEETEVPIPVASPLSASTGYLEQYWLPPGRSVWSKAEGR